MHSKPASIEWKAIAERLAEGYSTEDLCKAIDGCHRSPFHQGHNDSGTKHTGLRIIVRDGSQVAQFMAIADAPPGASKQAVSPATQRILAVAQSWLAKNDMNATEVCQ